MKLEDQLTSLELSKKLKELGVKQDSYFAWSGVANYPNGHTLAYLNGTQEIVVIEGKKPHPDGGCSAFTVAELGEILPTKDKNWQTARYDDDRWFITDFGNTLPAGEADTEADARAKMLIYLIENNLLPVAQKNQGE